MGLFSFVKALLFGESTFDGPPRKSSGGTNRREFLVTVQGVAIGSFLLPKLAGVAADTPTATRQILGRINRIANGDGFMLLWTESGPENKAQTWTWNPETKQEIAEAMRFYNAARGVGPDAPAARKIKKGSAVVRPPEELALIDAILNNPQSEAPYLAYAEYLENQGDAYGPFIRAHVQLRPLRDLPGENPFRDQLYETMGDLSEAMGPTWTKPITDLGFEPKIMSIVHIDFWLDEWGVISEFAVDRPGVLPELANRFFTALPLLRRLNLEDSEIDVLAVARLPQMKQIEALEIERKLDAEEFATLVALPTMPRLKELELAYCELEPTSGRDLASSALMGRLRKLKLLYCRLGDRGVEELVRTNSCRELRDLDLSYNTITGPGLAAIGNCPHLIHLEHLNLRSNEIRTGYETLPNAAFVRTLQELDLESCLPDATAIGHLAGTKFQNLRTLKLSFCHLSGEAFAKLSQSSWLANLHKLELSSTKLTAADLAPFAATRCPNLEELSLGYNPIGDAGAMALGSGPEWPKLKVLNLIECGIESAGIQSLAQSSRFPILEALDLRYLPISADDVNAILANPTWKRLKRFYLSEDKVSPKLRDRLTKHFGDNVVSFM